MAIVKETNAPSEDTGQLGDTGAATDTSAITDTGTATDTSTATDTNTVPDTNDPDAPDTTHPSQGLRPASAPNPDTTHDLYININAESVSTSGDAVTYPTCGPRTAAMRCRAKYWRQATPRKASVDRACVILGCWP